MSCFIIFFVSANLPNLIDGVSQSQFGNILREFLYYRDIEDFNNVFSALEFQYTYWPLIKNETYIRQELIEVRILLIVRRGSLEAT